VNTVDVDSLNNYMNVFIDKFVELNSKNVVKVEENITEKKVKDDDVKQDLYRHVKNIYDKWIGGTIDGKPYNTCGGVSSKDKSLFSYFKFIDSTFSDISNKARINLNSLVILSNNKGVNLSNLVSRVFNENGFILHSLPTYIDYSDKKEVKNIFRTYTRIEDVVSSPTFVGMYNSGNSKILDLGKNSEYRNDSYDFIDDASSIPNTMNDTSTEKSVVVYRVGFGDENQSIFKNLRISQEDFSETSESLQVLSEYVDNKGSTQRVFKGSNLYNLYSLRSYNLNFDMMGNAMIQPLMYLQLDNIPMFHGAYTVMNVSHDITPNTMNTTVRAVRKSKFTVPIVTDSTTFLPLDLNKTLDIKTDVLVNTVTDIPTDNIAPNTLNTFVNPVKGDMIITSKKGFRRGEPHNGVDIGISNGTQLYSSWSGIINRFVQGKDGKEGYGLYVIIDHSNNTEKSFDDGFYYYTLYAHLSNVNVNNLVQVKTGQNFGLSGGIKGAVNSGNSGGPHLHYEIRRSPKKLTDIRGQFFKLSGNNILDPISFFKKTGDIADNSPDHGQLITYV
jgi:murein DD-endopeptidase MepM/ murein hydrolase activator NlpD